MKIIIAVKCYCNKLLYSNLSTGNELLGDELVYFLQKNLLKNHLLC